MGRGEGAGGRRGDGKKSEPQRIEFISFQPVLDRIFRMLCSPSGIQN